MGFARNIKALREAHGLTQAELAKIAGASRPTVTSWELDGAQPRRKYLDAIVEHFGITMDDLTSETQGVYAQTRGLVGRMFKAVPAEARAPLYGRIAAGVPIEAIPVEETHWVDPDVLADHPRGFYLIVQGESMNRELLNGSYAFIDPDAEINNGDTVALNVNGYDATIKRYYRRGSTVELHPNSWDDSYKVAVYDSTRPDTESITLIGKVVWNRMPSQDEKL